MTKTHERLLIATLAGIIIVGAAAFAVGPSIASAGLAGTSQFAGPSYDVLTLRLSAKA